MINVLPFKVIIPSNDRITTIVDDLFNATDSSFNTVDVYDNVLYDNVRYDNVRYDDVRYDDVYDDLSSNVCDHLVSEHGTCVACGRVTKYNDVKLLDDNYNCGKVKMRASKKNDSSNRRVVKRTTTTTEKRRRDARRKNNDKTGRLVTAKRRVDDVTFEMEFQDYDNAINEEAVKREFLNVVARVKIPCKGIKDRERQKKLVACALRAILNVATIADYETFLVKRVSSEKELDEIIGELFTICLLTVSSRNFDETTYVCPPFCVDSIRVTAILKSYNFNLDVYKRPVVNAMRCVNELTDAVTKFHYKTVVLACAHIVDDITSSSLNGQKPLVKSKPLEMVYAALVTRVLSTLFQRLSPYATTTTRLLPVTIDDWNEIGKEYNLPKLVVGSGKFGLSLRRRDADTNSDKFYRDSLCSEISLRILLVN